MISMITTSKKELIAAITALDINTPTTITAIDSNDKTLMNYTFPGKSDYSFRGKTEFEKNHRNIVKQLRKTKAEDWQ